MTLKRTKITKITFTILIIIGLEIKITFSMFKLLLLL